MTSDIRLLYPDFQFTGTIATYETAASGKGIRNVCTGPRWKMFSTATRTNNDLWINIDLGSGNDATPDALYIARANLLKKDRIGGASPYGVKRIYVRRSAQSFFAPYNYSNLQFWFDSTRGATKDASDLVTAWTNLASTGDASVITASPTWLASNGAYNNNPAVDFDGTNDSLGNSGGTSYIGGKSALTVFLAVQYDASTPDKRIVQGYSNNNVIPFHVDASRVYTQLDGTSTAYASAGSNGTTYIYTMVFDGSQVGDANRLKRYRDGAQETLTYLGTGVPATTAAATGYRLGHSATPGNYFNGRILELVCYSSAFNSTDRVDVETYLTNKWQTAYAGATESLQSDTLYGPRGEDMILSLSTSSARHWGVQMGCSQSSAVRDTSTYPFSKLFLGRYFDFGFNPIWGRRAERTVLHNGNREPRYDYSFKWVGITNTNTQDFMSKIGKYTDVNPVVITTTSYHDVLQDARMVLCKINDITITPELHDHNTIEIDFEELI